MPRGYIQCLCGGESKSTFSGIVWNQMALASVQLYRIDEAIELFEKGKKDIGTRMVEDAIEILGYILKIREEKLRTQHLDVDDEKKRLAKLLEQAGK
ncbi:hypothetical protein V6N13_146650 [Hibiscus sabdariffa]|uniref:Uncharacterized protein n=1 Tax=Hibiscus sabdariffa TaxID=183260 RepID=A0ABR2TTW3_9ROSI